MDMAGTAVVVARELGDGIMTFGDIAIYNLFLLFKSYIFPFFILSELFFFFFGMEMFCA